MKYFVFSISIVLLSLLVTGLFLMSFVFGAMDGCRDAGYNTFAVGINGVYCINDEAFIPFVPHAPEQGDL